MFLQCSSSSSFVLPAPAKLNLFLHIVGRKEDGYHNLQTIFQFLDYSDELIFETNDNLELICDVPQLANDDNLILKAAKLLQNYTDHDDKGARIKLNKLLPIGGGVGGGSSNAATTLHGLNMLWDLRLEENELAELGLKLGADVPVFVRGYAAFAEGVGEELTPIMPEEYWYAVVKPDCRVNTTEMFRHPQLTRDTHPIKISAALDELQGNKLGNDFQSLVCRLYPEVNKCLLLLNNNTSKIGRAMMSGSGACVFAPFSSREQAELTLSAIESEVDGFVAHGVNTSPLHKSINQLQAQVK